MISSFCIDNLVERSGGQVSEVIVTDPFDCSEDEDNDLNFDQLILKIAAPTKVSRIALRRCSQNVFVFVFVFVIFLVMSCLLITLIKCLNGRKSLGLLFVCQK